MASGFSNLKVKFGNIVEPIVVLIIIIRQGLFSAPNFCHLEKSPHALNAIFFIVKLQWDTWLRRCLSALLMKINK